MKKAWLLGSLYLALGVGANAGYLPATCYGTCGTDTGNGSVPNAPSGNPYAYVTTTGGSTGGGTIPVGALGSETNGSTLTTGLFVANTGDSLDFNFDYITSDGSGYADYAWAALMNPDGTEAALLFTAQTEPSPASIVPGEYLPPTDATLNPSSVPIAPGTTWNELGSWSGDCWASGCGNSGWVGSSYDIPVAGTYYLAFGVTNVNDTFYDSGLAIDNITDAGNSIPVGTPEPASMAMIVFGLAGIAIGARRSRTLNH